jgi:aspartate kinase
MPAGELIMRFLVQKFGGTSLLTQELREQAAAKAIAAREEGYNPVLVVSAMGRMNDPFATDTLIGFARQVYRGMESREMDVLMACGEIISGVAMAGTFQKLGYSSVFLTGSQAGIITDNNFNDARILKVQPESIVKHARKDNFVVVAGFQGRTEDGEITTLGRGGSDTTAAALGVALGAEYVDI